MLQTQHLKFKTAKRADITRSFSYCRNCTYFAWQLIWRMKRCGLMAARVGRQTASAIWQRYSWMCGRFSLRQHIRQTRAASRNDTWWPNSVLLKVSKRWPGAVVPLCCVGQPTSDKLGFSKWLKIHRLEFAWTVPLTSAFGLQLTCVLDMFQTWGTLEKPMFDDALFAFDDGKEMISFKSSRFIPYSVIAYTTVVKIFCIC